MDGGEMDYFEGMPLDSAGLRRRLYWAWWVRQQALAFVADFLEQRIAQADPEPDVIVEANR